MLILIRRTEHRQTGERQTSGGLVHLLNTGQTQRKLKLNTEQQQLDLNSQTHSVMSAGPQDSSVEQRRLQRRGENASYQIFPEPLEQLEPVKGGAARLKKRLPSIVVEPSEEREEDSGGLQWPPLNTQTSIDEEEDPFQEHCEPSSGSQEQQTDANRALHFKRSSIPCIQIDYSRLTPPPSPTSSHVAPPRFRS